ncbi:MAG: hypothetical protein NE330_08790 [Lentisphaeraceae bacterium]|nr:hypothetical protein [Lentisphaeraceae bacterium]
MARPKKVTINQRGKRWNILFHDVNQNQQRKSLKTDDKQIAEGYKEEMERLIHLNLPYGHKSLTYFTPFIYEMFYLQEFVYFISDIEWNEDSEIESQNKLLQELCSLRQSVVDPETGKTWKEKYLALSRTIEGQLALASERIPPYSEVLAQFKVHVSNLYRKGIKNIQFIESFMAEIKMKPDGDITTITPTHINQYLSLKIKDSKNKNTAWNRYRITFSKFFKWACSQWQFPNPVDLVETRKSEAESDIVWHSLEEIKNLLKDKTLYWQSAIGLMAFAGLSAHELRGLKREDILIDIEPCKVRITPNEHRRLKSSNRKRNVAIHKEHLLPILLEYINETKPTDILFPPLVPSKTKIWHENTFTRHLNGYVNKTKNEDKSYTISGQLPEGYGALSLRRTFGSLLIRSGKTEVEVAAAMGNSPEMVRKHYARILGDEINIDF